MLLRPSLVNISWRPSGSTMEPIALAVCFSPASWILFWHLRNSVARLCSVVGQDRQQAQQQSQQQAQQYRHQQAQQQAQRHKQQ
jgi:hypothetical protein